MAPCQPWCWVEKVTQKWGIHLANFPSFWTGFCICYTSQYDIGMLLSFQANLMTALQILHFASITFVLSWFGLDVQDWLKSQKWSYLHKKAVWSTHQSGILISKDNTLPKKTFSERMMIGRIGHWTQRFLVMLQWMPMHLGSFMKKQLKWHHWTLDLLVKQNQVHTH